MKRMVTFLIAALLFSGCAKKVVTEVPTTDYKKEIEEYRKYQASKKPSPSLWTDMGSYGTFFLDYKGRKVGDIVIVKIIESSSASNSNTVKTSKSTSYKTGITSLLGLPTHFGMTNFLNSGNKFDPNIDASTNNSFSGKGQKQKSDTVTATIAARVIDVLPSGNLVIEGHREIVVDQEKQVISVKGVIRQKDIDANNTVLSTAIADAQITYSGKGMLTDANKKGWLASVIDWVWPF
ncbi:flagellar basal body L-ring protein FlgH [Deferribacter autotrophicus]|uniref:Flagellar L-ring protein n=1 Tax=Deferribacter autotrophicus TaxID=500465 RepID=A0A5A8F410_9BACT|nr:flagellar basal body L-ring protein FlgH [Deferribacter autotrophicus]KAA0258766.1 flagellar basal body L-ring protein FlgH [Deferribacter autotrophicus]